VEKDIRGKNGKLGHFEYGRKLLLCLDVAEKVLVAEIFVPEVEPKSEWHCELVSSAGEATGKVNQVAIEN
jgi:hypothetical protein